MSGRRIATITGVSILGLIVVVLITAFVVVQTDWFRNYVREKIISVTEEATGGKVDIARFDFDWSHMRATVDGFVLHGTERPGEAPLFQARKLTVDLKLFSSLSQKVDLRALIADQPQANVIVYPDGTTNVPAPKVKKQSDKSALETVVELAVGRFELNNGSFHFATLQTPLDAQGENLHALLQFSQLKRAYEGQLALDRLLVGYEKNPPLRIHAELPVVIEKDRITLNDGRITTPKSEAFVSGALENMTDPRTSLQVKARLNVQEFAPLAGVKVGPEPSTLNADIALRLAGNTVDITTAHANLGGTQVEASGSLAQGIQLNASLVTGELFHLLRIDQKPAGTVQIATKLQGSFDDLNLNPLKLGALGGQFAGAASLKQKHLLALNGELQNFDTRTLSGLMGGKPLAYDGVISGPVQIDDDLNRTGATGLEAEAKLRITPGRRGVPLSGALNAHYNGATGAIDVAPSHIALPNSRLDVAGAIGSQVRVKLTSRNLSDFKPLADLPIQLNGGSLNFDGTVTGSTAAPRIAGHVAMDRFSVEGRAFDSLTADLAAAPNGASVSNAVLARGPMQAQVAAKVGLRKWKPEPNQPLSATAAIHRADVADLLALAGQADIPATGALEATANVSGTVGNPGGTVNVTAVNGKLYDQPYDRLQAQVNLADQLVTLQNAYLTSGAARLDLNASFRHPRDSFKTGNIQAHVVSNQIDLAQFQQFVKQTPGLGGTANTNLDVSATLAEVKGQSEFQVTIVSGDAAVRGLRAEGEAYGDVTATVRTAGNTVSYKVDSNLAGSTLRVNGQTQLVPEYPTNASATLANLPLERVLKLAGQRDIPARGTLSGNANFSGTMRNPTGSGDLTLANAVLYDEPVERLHARLNMTQQAIELPLFEAVAGPSRINLNAAYTHPVGDLMNGQVRFQVTNSTVQLAQLRTLQKRQPGLAGAIRLSAQGGATVVKTKTGEDVQLTSLNANVDSSGLAMNRMNLGDAHLAADTKGDRMTFTLDSDIARSRIHGQGTATLRGDYPVNAEVTFNNVTYDGLRPLFNASSSPAPEFDAVAEGRVTITGPAKNFEAMQGRFEITRIEAGNTAKSVTLKNQGPIVASFDKAVVRIESAHIVGPQTDINLTGQASQKAMDLKLNATTNLGILQQMTKSIYAAGVVAVRADVTGTPSDPRVNGRMELKNASLNLIDVPNGLSNANGVVVFNASTATIQNLTAESGGGKVSLGGTVGFGGGMLSYALKANATDVRVRYPPGASVNTDAALNLSGTSQRSVLGGTVTIQQLGFSPRNDFGSMLSSTANPVKVPSAPSGPLTGMRLDVRIRTAPGISVQTSLAQNIQADADLHLRGTLADPGMTGRVNISQGELIFFGTNYTVNQGSIAFYNPFSIQPNLNIDLETVAKGVDVVLTISGPIENMKLTYRSDPPLQFQELVGLLAAGKTPTSDPTILANQPAAPAQSYQQMGESAIVSQAIASPISSRLQRVFGVNKLKIDPTFTSGSELPQARLTLQQQVTSNLTFTYITNLTQANSQIIRVEWALSDQWSAIATREETGRFGVDFFYKKKFR